MEVRALQKCDKPTFPTPCRGALFVDCTSVFLPDLNSQPKEI